MLHFKAISFHEKWFKREFNTQRKLYVGDLNELIFNFLNISIFSYTGHPIFLRMIKERISPQIVDVISKDSKRFGLDPSM